MLARMQAPGRVREQSSADDHIAFSQCDFLCPRLIRHLFCLCLEWLFNFRMGSHGKPLYVDIRCKQKDCIEKAVGPA